MIQLDVNVINQWSATQQYARRGVIYPFFYSYAFDTSQRVMMLQRQNLYMNPMGQMPHIPEDQKVNIVAIMLESYNGFFQIRFRF